MSSNQLPHSDCMGIAERVVDVRIIAASQVLQQRHRTQRGKGEAAIALRLGEIVWNCNGTAMEMAQMGTDAYGSIWLKLVII